MEGEVPAPATDVVAVATAPLATSLTDEGGGLPIPASALGVEGDDGLLAACDPPLLVRVEEAV